MSSWENTLNANIPLRFPVEYIQTFFLWTLPRKYSETCRWLVEGFFWSFMLLFLLGCRPRIRPKKKSPASVVILWIFQNKFINRFIERFCNSFSNFSFLKFSRNYIRYSYRFIFFLHFPFLIWKLLQEYLNIFEGISSQIIPGITAYQYPIFIIFIEFFE